MSDNSNQFKKPADPTVVAKQAPLTTNAKNTLLACLTRSQDAFEQAYGRVTEDHFSDSEQHLKLAWSLLCKIYDEIGELPNRDIFMSEAQDLLDSADKGAHTEEDVVTLEAWIDWTYDPAIVTTKLEAKDMTWITSRLRRLLREQLVIDLHNKVVNNGRVVTSLGPMLDSYQEKAASIESLTTEKTSVAFPEGWDKTAGIKIYSTSIDCLDKFTNNGDAAGEVYGLMGPFGSCKTTVAVMRAVEAARTSHAMENSPDWDGVTRLSFMFSYEARLDELRQRIISYAAGIPRDSVESMGTTGKEMLSTAQSLKPYELADQHTSVETGSLVQGEQERMDEVIPWLNKYLRIIDMTGHAEGNKGAGNGYIEEIAAKIKNELLSETDLKLQPFVVVVDYVGIMCKRYLAAKNKDESQLTNLVTAAGGRAANLIAKRFNCAVWLLHQLNGESNSKSAGTMNKHTDAANSKSFAENLDFAIQFGTPTIDGLCQVVCTKHRRFKAMPPMVIRIVGEFNKIEPADSKYKINASTGKIEDSSATHGVFGADDDAKPKADDTAKPAPSSGKAKSKKPFKPDSTASKD